MDAQTLIAPTRRPRFRRASGPPAFRLTDDDVHTMRQLARHRFLKSTHIPALVGRSLDRTNDRLSRLFHAGYVDRPRAQLGYYPTAGSSLIAYALADRGAAVGCLLVVGSEASAQTRYRFGFGPPAPQYNFFRAYPNVQVPVQRRCTCVYVPSMQTAGYTCAYVRC